MHENTGGVNFFMARQQANKARCACREEYIDQYRTIDASLAALTMLEQKPLLLFQGGQFTYIVVSYSNLVVCSYGSYSAILVMDYSLVVIEVEQTN